MTTIFDFPVFSRWDHKGPADGMCFMECVSVLAGESFSDRPECADSTLAMISRTVNDNIDKSELKRLIPFLGRVINTSSFSNERDIWPEVTGLVSLVAPESRPDGWQFSQVQVTHILKWVGQARSADEMLRRFTLVLDAFDEVTGHKPEEVDLSVFTLPVENWLVS